MPIPDDAPADAPELDIIEAMRGYCSDAWFGRKPKLARFTLDILFESDWSGAAAHAGDIRQAA